MKRLVLLMIFLVTAVSMTGCQSRGFGRRGAGGAQQSAPSYTPGFNSQQQMQVPGCQGCNSGDQTGAVMMPEGAVISEGVQTGSINTQQFPTTPIIEDGGHIVVDRQVVPGSMTMSNANGSISTVPGPESAPLPRS